MSAESKNDLSKSDRSIVDLLPKEFQAEVADLIRSGRLVIEDGTAVDAKTILAARHIDVLLAKKGETFNLAALKAPRYDAAANSIPLFGRKAAHGAFGQSGRGRRKYLSA